MEIKSIGRNVEIWIRTRKIQTQIQEVMFEGIAIDSKDMKEGADMKNIVFPLNNLTRADNLTVKLMFWLTDDEFDNLTTEEFDALKEEIGKKK